MIVAFDIETIPNTSMVERLPEPSVATGNLKDEAKIATKIAEAKQSQREKMALDPLYGRVFCIGIATGSGVQAVARMEENTDEGEVTVIENFFSYLNGGESLRLVSWNGNGFDLPFIFKRAALLGIDCGRWNLPALSTFTRKGSQLHVDLMVEWAGYGRFQKLDDVSSAMYGEQKAEIDFKDFLPALENKDAEKLQQIEDYCKRDCSLTLAIYERMSGILF